MRRTGEKGYQELLKRCLLGDRVVRRNDKSFTAGPQTLTYYLDQEIPLPNTKRLWWKGVWSELLWMVTGRTNVKWLNEHKNRIWDLNGTKEFLKGRGLEYPEKHLGPVYGWQGRSWNHPYSKRDKDGKAVFDEGAKKCDQLKNITELLIEDPTSRRAVLTYWNPQQIDEMALPPCHLMYIFNIVKNRMNITCTMRSTDVFLGLPFNLFHTYLLLLMMIQQVNRSRATSEKLVPGILQFSTADAHLYSNQVEAVFEQLNREIKKSSPKVTIKDRGSWDDYLIDDLKIEGYKPHKAIKVDMIA